MSAALEPAAAWPGILRTAADLSGDDAALALALEFGGQTIYFPKGAFRHGHPVSVSMGRAAADALCRSFGGERLYIPRARPQCARLLSREGIGPRVIAARLGTSVRTVLRYLSL